MVEILNEKIKELRTNANLKQSELASRLGIATNTLCQYEKNKANPSIEILIKIADIFDVSVDYLIGREDDFGVNTSGAGFDLSAEERQIITDYRALSPGLKQMIKTTLDIYLNRVTVTAESFKPQN